MEENESLPIENNFLQGYSEWIFDGDSDEPGQNLLSKVVVQFSIALIS